MDFLEFVEQYKLRTAKRMADFEAAINEAHRKMEQAGRQQQMVRDLNLRKPPMDPPRGAYRPPRRGGRVQQILQRDDPTGAGPTDTEPTGAA
ncbi:hypothetical protein [Corynebacterium timonense]|uniref:Uncharacterized protein n=2 Tax=Corynebacterium timonense TaxID=441500 RepID=A0A1H1SIC6_9CORY|nr:hypothetical protein [Corynebacterium timonense]SDS47790.1 hypothetical protein SAMN04488539_1753 [Corynebacterium timonense]